MRLKAQGIARRPHLKPHKTKSPKLRTECKDFLVNNPWSKLQEDKKELQIRLPWNDSSLILAIGKKEYANASLLDDVLLPERFNGIYHKKERKFEFIFNTLFDKKENAPSEPFKFHLRSRTLSCCYAAPSKAALFLARVFVPVYTSVASVFRNLDSLEELQNLGPLSRLNKGYLQNRKGLSFFLEPVDDYDEDEFVTLCKHLNFYMSYFERESPQIEIVQVGSPAEDSDELPLQKSLPTTINARELDQFLLDLSSTARDAEVRLRFLYYYQILEYSAFYWVEDYVKASICKVLMAPDLQSRLDDYFPKLIEALGPTRQQDEHKIRKVIEARVEPRAVWNEIKQNMPYFSSEHAFEGGFVIDPFVSKEMSEDAFVKMWSPKAFEVLRGIRNSLVHARESRTQSVISPTVGNDKLLEPWVPVIRLMAEQVMIFED
jgi:hypothetical protein